MNKPGWHDRRVLVTGHTGFKGTWLSLWLDQLGACVTGLSDSVPDSRSSMFESVGIGSDLAADERGDVCDLARVSEVIDAAQPEVIFHLAAQPLVRASYADPTRTFAVNVGGTINVLEAIRSSQSVRAAVIVTTDKCYENREWPWPYREYEPMGGDDPYSASKACAELATKAYRESYFADEAAPQIASARAGNVIGGGDWSADRIVPDVISTLMRDEPLILRYPDAVRPWQHVLAPLDGYIRLAERMLGERGFNRAWNFGPAPDDAKPVRWLAETFMRGTGRKWDQAQGESAPEARTLKLDSSLARERLQWAPPWDAEEAATRTLAWYEAHARGEDMREFSVAQIDAFTGDAG